MTRGEVNEWASREVWLLIENALDNLDENETDAEWSEDISNARAKALRRIQNRYRGGT